MEGKGEKTKGEKPVFLFSPSEERYDQREPEGEGSASTRKFFNLNSGEEEKGGRRLGFDVKKRKAGRWYLHASFHFQRCAKKQEVSQTKRLFIHLLES